MNLAYEAMMFAREVHKDQRRKYSGNPYADHLAEVAGIVATVVADLPAPQEVVVATAWLHDSVEDQGVQPETLRQRFGPAVEEGVMWLSDLEQGNRAERKRLSCQRLARAPWLGSDDQVCRPDQQYQQHRAARPELRTRLPAGEA